MYGLIGIDPSGDAAGTPDVAVSHAASSPGSAQPACAPPTCDSLPRPSGARSGQLSPNALSLGTSLGSGGPASIMAAFTAFVQQMFGQIASWMQHPTLSAASAPPAPRYLESRGSGGLPPANP